MAAVSVASLVVVTLVVAVLESGAVGVPDASAVYLLAVVGVAVAFGTTPAILTSVGAFLLYDFLFTAPRYTLTVHDPGEWLNLLLLLVIGAVVGRLAGEERERAVRALAREREARALFKISSTLAGASDTTRGLGSIVETLRAETTMTRVWVTIGQAVAADTAAGTNGSASTPRHPDRPAVGTRPRRAIGSSSRPPSDGSARCGPAGHASWATPTPARRVCWPLPRTSSVRRWSATG